MNTHFKRNLLITALCLSILAPYRYNQAGQPAGTSQLPTTETPGIEHPVPLPSGTAVPAPSASPAPTPAFKPSAPPKTKRTLSPVTGIKAVRYSTTSIKLMWKTVKNASFYKLYTATQKNGRYVPAGTTKNTRFRLKKCKKNTTYYIRIQACSGTKSPYSDSKLSSTVSIRTKSYQRTTVFAGDSITTGLTVYRTINKINIGGRKKVAAAIGLNTVTFRTKRSFNGQSCLNRVISYKPYRVYLMLGMNELHFRKSGVMIAQYKELITAIKNASPDTDIVLLAVSPVTQAQCARRTGYRQISGFNSSLKTLARKTGCKYFNYTNFLKNKGGFLKSTYSAGDGCHWNTSGYNRFAEIIEKYDKAQDK